MINFKDYLKESSEFARIGTANRKKAMKGQLPDSVHKHIENLIDAARNEGKGGSSDATDMHHDKLVHHLLKHIRG